MSKPHFEPLRTLEEQIEANYAQHQFRTFNKSDLTGIAIVAGIVLLAFFEIAFMGKTFQTSAESVGVNGWDAPTGYFHRVPFDSRLDPGASAWQMEPWAEVTNRTIREGQLPLWNPFQGAGTPLAANMQSAPLDPLLAWVNQHPTQLAWDLSFLAAFMLGGIATYAFCRIRGLERLAAVTGAGAFAMTGYFMLYSNNHWFRTFLYLPVLCLFIELTVRSRRVLPVIVLGVAIAGPIYMGMPEASFFVLVTAGCFALYRSIRGPGEGSPLRRLLRLAAGGTLGLAIASPLLLIFVDYLRVSYHAHQATAHTGLVVDPKPWLLNWMFPFINGGSISNGGIHSVTRGWAGMAVMTASVIAMTARMERRQFQGWFFGGIAMVALMKVYGFPGVQWIGALPLAVRANFPLLLPVVGFCTAMLAAIGVQAIADGAIVRSRAVPAIAVFGAALALLFRANEKLLSSLLEERLFSRLALIAGGAGVVLIVAFFFSKWVGMGVAVALVGAEMALLVPRVIGLLRVSGAGSNIIEAAKKISGGGRDIVLLQLALGLTATAVVLIATFALSHRAGAYLAAIVILVELLALTPKGIYPVRSDPYRAPSWFSVISKGMTKEPAARVFGLDAKLFPNTAGAIGVQDIRSVDAIYLLRYVTYIRSFIEPEFKTRFAGGAFGQNEEQTPANFEDNRMFDLLGVRYLITGTRPPGGSEYRDYSLVAGGGSTNVFENLSRAPRAFVAHTIHQVRDMNAAVLFFASSEPRFPDGAIHVVQFDPLKEAVVETTEDIHLFSEERPIELLSQTTEKPPHIVSYTPNKVVIEADLNRPGLLVLTDMYAPGWEVLVDGKPNQIFPTDVAFRGVMLKAGLHRVVFRYRPRSFTLGIVVAALALLIASGAATLSWLHRRSKFGRKALMAPRVT